MTPESNKVYEFGPFLLDPRERQLLRDKNPIPITAKAFDMLLMLVQKSGHLVEKADLIQAVWPDSFVEEGNLNVVICALRKALDDERRQPTYIQTVAKRGYRFIREARSRREDVPAFSFALIYIGLGQSDRAFEWLEKSYHDRSAHMVYSKTNPLLDPLRSNPRFDSLIHRMGL